MSYRRDLDDDDDSCSNAPQEASSSIIASKSEVTITEALDTSANNSIITQEEQKKAIEAVATSSSSVSASDSTDESTKAIDSAKNRKARRKTDYSKWTTVARPPSAQNPDVERFIAWAQSGKSINANLRNSKEFHNPSILTELVNMCGVKEKGTNIPHEKRGLSFAPSDHHEALIAAQEAQLLARLAQQQPGKRTHIDFVKRSNPNSHQGAPDAKRFKR